MARILHGTYDPANMSRAHKQRAMTESGQTISGKSATGWGFVAGAIAGTLIGAATEVLSFALWIAIGAVVGMTLFNGYRGV